MLITRPMHTNKLRLCLTKISLKLNFGVYFCACCLNAVDIQGFLQGGFVNINRLCPVVERERMEYANPTGKTCLTHGVCDQGDSCSPKYKAGYRSKISQLPIKPRFRSGEYSATKSQHLSIHHQWRSLVQFYDE